MKPRPAGAAAAPGGGRAGGGLAAGVKHGRRAAAGDYRHLGPQAVAFYASGQLLTEDYYAANKLMKGFIGAANIDTNSRLCMSSAVAGYKRAFGEDVVPCSYEDVENSDLVVLVGSNAAWTHPVLYQRLVQARQNNPQMKVVVIDPRKTATCDIADLHLALAPGSDAGLFVGLLNLIQVPTTGRLPAWPGFVVLMHRRLPRFTTGSSRRRVPLRSTPWGSTSLPAAATSATPSLTSILRAGNLPVRAAGRFR